MAYSPEERETIIQMDDKDPQQMRVCTYQRSMITKLSKIQGAVPVSVERDEKGRVIGATYILPSRLLTIRTKLPPKGAINSGCFTKKS